MDVTYIRYQDDIIIFCKSKRQLNRCKQRMMAVLKERRLRLSSKKTGIGRCWSTWWVGTAQSWQYQELLEWFLNVCWDLKPAAYAAGLLHHAMIKTANHDAVTPSPGFHATA